MAGFKSKKNKIWIIIILIVFSFLLVLDLLLFKELNYQNLLLTSQQEENTKPLIRKLKINSKIIKVEVVSSPLAEYRGLSNRKTLCPDCGMLFNFKDEQIREFVMRNMNFPLDIIFIAQGHIKKIDSNLAPAGAKPKIIYKSGVPANQVLEINGAYAHKWGIKVGDQVELLK